MMNSPKSRFGPILRGFLITAVANIAEIVAFFFIYRIIGSNFGAEGVGEYSLVRRVAALFSPVLILGLGVGMPRYIGMSLNREQRGVYIRAAGLAVATFTFVFLIIINIFADYFARLCFGSIDYADLVLPFSFLLAGLVVHSLVYAYFRGRLWVKIFNILELVNISLVPLVIIIFFRDITIREAITFIGVTTLSIALCCCIFLVKEAFVSIERSQLKYSFKNSLKELLGYSIPRVPGDFALAGIFSVGSIFASHWASIQEVGYYSVSLSLVQATGTAIMPMSTVLLPFVSSMVIRGQHESIKENVNSLTGAVTQCFVFASFQLIIFADTIIEYWLGSEFLGATIVLRIALLSVTFYAFYIAMRSVLDAARFKPINAMNLFISLAVFLLVTGTLLLPYRPFSPIINLSVAFTCALACLGILTYYQVRKIYSQRMAIDLQYLWVAIAINVVLGVIAVLAKPFVVSKFYYPILLEVFLGIVYLLSLWMLKVDWIRQVWQRVIGRD
jgi:O-antigen/teichoic acid export membrane protein